MGTTYEPITGAKVTNGSVNIYGLARNIAAVAAGVTYNATEILGYHIVAPGSGNWSMTPVGGVAVTGIVPGAFIAGHVYPEHLSSITVGTGGAVLIYIP